MKKLNNKGVSLAETLAALTVIGIVLGVALTAVNSRAIQLKILNDEMEAKFILTDESNRYYLTDPVTSSTPSSFMNSKHIIQNGADLKTNPNIPSEISKELTDLVNDKEYLLSYVQDNDRYYHLIRLTTFDASLEPGDSENQNNLFPDVKPNPDQGGDVKPNPDDKIPPVKPNPPVEVDESENNMPILHTNIISKQINDRMAAILKVPTPESITPENKYNEDIFRRSRYAKGNSAASTKIPTKITVVNDPLGIQVKLYSRNEHTGTIEGLEYKEIQFFCMLKFEFDIGEKKYIDYVKTYGQFTADYKRLENKLIITSPVSNLPDPSYNDRFWNKQSDFKINLKDGVILDCYNSIDSGLSYSEYEYNADLIRDAVGYEIIDYVENKLLKGNDLN